MPSRYGPPAYVTNNVGEILGNAISNAASNFVQRRRQKKLDEQQALGEKARLYQEGVREGTPPAEYRTDTIAPPDFTVPSSADLAAHLRGVPFPGAATPPTPQPFTAPSTAELGRMIANPGVTPASRYDVMPGNAPAGTSTSDGRDHAPTHPGAFDVATRQFGGSPLQLATAAQHTGAAGPPTDMQVPYNSGRYQPLDASHYVDTTQTPAAVAQRQRMEEEESRARFAEELKRTDPLYQANVAHVNEETAASQAKAAANHRAFNTIAQSDPTNPLVQAGFDEGTDYQGELRTSQTERTRRDQSRQKALSDYNALKAEFPKHALAGKQFDENTDYSAVLASERQNKGLTAAADRQRPRFNTFVDKEGQEHYVTEEEGARQGWVPSAKGSRVGSIAPLALTNFARFKAAVPTLDKQHAVMLEFENAALKDPTMYDGLDAFKAAFYRLPTDMSFTAAVETAIAQSDMNKHNPRLVRYLRAGERYTFEDGTVQQRGGTDARRIADQWISTVGPDMDEATVRDTQEGRQTRIDGYRSIIPTIDVMLNKATGGGGGAQQGGSGGAQQHTKVSDADFARAWKAGKRSDADIAAWVAANPAGKP